MDVQLSTRREYLDNRVNIIVSNAGFNFVIVVFLIQALMHDFIDILHLSFAFTMTKMFAVVFAGFVSLPNINKISVGTRRIEYGWLVFGIVVLIYGNWDLRNGYWYVAFFYSVTVLLVFMLSYSTNWINTFFDVLKIFTIIHAIGTLLFFVFPSLYSLYRPIIYATSESPYLDGYKSGLTLHYSTNAVYLAQGLIVYFTEMISNKKIIKKGLIPFILILFALILTTKRAHLLFGVIVLFFIYYIQTGHFLRIIKFLFVGVLLLVGVYILAQWIPEIGNALERFTGGNLSDMTGRNYIYEAVYQLFSQNPIFGRGWNWFMYSDVSRFLSQKYNFIFVGTEYIQVHNVYLQLLLEVGIVGFVLLMFLFIKTLLVGLDLYRRLWRDNKLLDPIESKFTLFSIGYQIFFLCYCMTGNPLYDTMVYIVYFFSCAVVIALRRKYSSLLTIDWRGGLD
ncbi:MAG: O-antigen ligase family protein [Oscillospiraceae bacterium]|jgi:O-antigen ligase|nr:O-antigen ligase family protein [Oscillospiraceae bacterium]